MPDTSGTEITFMKIDINRNLWFAFISVLLILTGGDSFAGQSPLNQGNRFPALFMFLTPSPDSPDLPQPGRFNVFTSVDYTSVFINEETDDWEALMDFEFTTVSLAVEMRITEKVALSAGTSFVRMGDGFLDGFLNDYHKAGGFPDYDRPLRPNNEFAYYIRETDGPYWFKAERNGFRPVDSVVSAKVQLVKGVQFPKDSGYAFSMGLKYSLKLPTGDAKQGLSSNGYDHGLFFLTTFSKKQMTFYLNPGFIIVDAPETEGADIDIANMATLFSGLTYALSEKWAVTGQLNCYSSPFDIDIRFFDYPGIELTLGFNYKYSKRLSFECAFSEDLAGSVPDFTVHSGLKCHF